ncbi:nucleotidyltransferase domain-containing protein [Patescibacteria group bacterium]|nr:nucleotidyltransferase domain-containing protein [Patescibacteria group bacterium]MBU4580723.1 nucleotidyltransferase domain-containing protein [Patescibacteria group bacterium]
MDKNQNKIKRLVNEYVKGFPSEIKVEGVFLFGSYATGKTREDSDVDLAVISPDFLKVNFIKRMEMLSMFRKSKITRSVPMDIIGYTPEEFKNIDKESMIMRRAKREGRMIYTCKN